MKTFILTDNDEGVIVAAVQTEGLDDGRFLTKAKQAISEHFCLNSVELFNWVDSSKKNTLYVEGMNDDERQGYSIGVVEVVCY